MKRLVLVCIAVLLARGLVTAEDKVVKETWDWTAVMREVIKEGKDNKEGVVLSLGDSITYANQSTRWAKTLAGATPEDQAVCQWSHAGKNDDSDGWWLAAVDRPGNRSETAASGVRTDAYISGGKGGLPSLKAIIDKYKPQVAFILLGANDATAGRKPEDVAKDMRTIIDTILANGTIPVLQMLAPRRDDGANELSKKYNESYLALAKTKKSPLSISTASLSHGRRTEHGKPSSFRTAYTLRTSFPGGRRPMRISRSADTCCAAGLPFRS